MWGIVVGVVFLLLFYLLVLGRGSLCICVFKGRIGKLTIDPSCRGCLSIWIIPEEVTDPAFTAPSADTSYSVDGFKIGNTIYKVDGSTCVEISCDSECQPIIWTCVNNLAWLLGKKAAYPVPAGTFGNEPPANTPAQPVK